MGIVHGPMTDEEGNQQYVSLRLVVVSGLGINLFFVTTAVQRGVTSLFHPTNPRLEKRGTPLGR